MQDSKKDTADFKFLENNPGKHLVWATFYLPVLKQPCLLKAGGMDLTDKTWAFRSSCPHIQEEVMVLKSPPPGGRGVHVWERMYTRGGFMSMYGKTNTVLESKIK